MTSPFSLPAHKFYGHYQPGLEMPAISDHHFQQFQKLKYQPLQRVDDIRRLVHALSEFLPAFKHASKQVESRRIILNLSEGSEFQVNPFPSDRAFIFLPRGVPFAEYAPEFITALGKFTPLPSESSVFQGPMDPQKIRTLSDVRMHAGWPFALGQSFLYQVAHEMTSLGIEMNRSTEGCGILSPRDISLFQIFKETGLAGLAHEYARFFLLQGQPSIHEGRDVLIFIMASQSQENSSIKNLPPPPKDLPESPMERSFQWVQKTLYQRFLKMTPLSPKERHIVLKGIDRYRISPKRLPLLMWFVIKMAPALAVHLLDVLDPEKDKWKIHPEIEKMDKSDLDPTLVLRNARHLLGLNPLEQFNFKVPEKTAASNIWLYFIYILSMAVMPPELLRPWKGPLPTTEEEKYRMLRHMEINYVRHVMWGYTGFFEFVYEANYRGFDFELDETNSQKEKIFREFGFLGLCERWEEFEDPDNIHALREELALLMEEYLSNPK